MSCSLHADHGGKLGHHFGYFNLLGTDLLTTAAAQTVGRAFFLRHAGYLSLIHILNAAGEALKEAGESDTLSGLVDSAKKEDLSKYTDESADAIRDAIAKAEEVIANRGSEEDLAEAYEALQNALNNAQLKPATPVTPENPDTGDGTPFALPLVLTLAAGAVLALRRRYGER